MQPGIGWKIKVKQIEIQNPETQPQPRTYHASTVVGDKMIIIGGEADSDMNDLWSFSFTDRTWTKPVINGGGSFLPKRFHSASTI